MSLGTKKMMSPPKNRRPKRLWSIRRQVFRRMPSKPHLTRPDAGEKQSRHSCFLVMNCKKIRWDLLNEFVLHSNYSAVYMSGRPVAKCEPKLSWTTQHDPWSHPTDDSALGKWEHMLLIRSILKYCVNNWKTFLMINRATKKRFGWSIFQSWLFWWRPMYWDFYPQHCIYEFEFELNYI